ncbi:MAG: hypothetical protein PHI41_09060 [Erysipelotrichaceae bacterium]|nr:hypothetical protein [Erysipelotrichaceae bacterium]
MEIQFKNIGVIDNGKISIESNYLNVKYGINGSGKSTIAKSIEQYVNKKSLHKLKKYGSEFDPEVSCKNDIASILTFNQNYVENFLFKEDIVNNTFEILINTDEYILLNERIDNKFIELYESVKKSDIQKIMQYMTEFENNIKFKTKNGPDGNKVYELDGVKKFAKAFKKPILEEVLTGRALDYKNKLDSDRNHLWIKWFSDGFQYYIENNKCPFCLSNLPGDLNEIKTQIDNLNTTNFKQNVEVKGNIDNLANNIETSKIESVRTIINDKKAPDPKAVELLYLFTTSCKNELLKLEKLLDLNVIRIKQMYEKGTLVDFLASNRLDLSFYNRDDQNIFAQIENINKSIEKIVTEVDEIEGIAKVFADKLNSNISNNCNCINDFLKVAGIPYKIEIIAKSEKDFTTVLKPLAVDQIVNGENLSFGERNAISLILFSLEANRHYDLIVLDDPVSSFDNNKKYALLYYLFLKDDAVLKNKTVLFFTHDFDIIVDLIYKNAFRGIKYKCHFVQNDKGSFKEKRIIQEKVCNLLRYWKKCAGNAQKCELIRTVNLRKFINYTNKEENAWNILSSLEHMYDFPSKNVNGGKVPLTRAELEIGIKVITETYSDFDYDKILSLMKDNKQLRKWYRESSSSVEKLQILRVYLNNNPDMVTNDVFFNFITETYHVENNEMMALDEQKFCLIPQYIMDVCDTLISN